METTAKQNFSKMTAENPMSSTPTVMVEENLGYRNNPAFESLRLRWVTKKPTSAGGLLNSILGGNNVEQRHTVQSFSKEVIALLGLAPGVNLNEKLKEAGYPLARVAISEITQSEFDNLEDTSQIGYSAKVNPATGELIGKDGEQIFRKVYLTDVDTQDEYIVSDGKGVSSTVDATSEEELPM